MDYAQLSVHSIQSVSDQTDFRLSTVSPPPARHGHAGTGRGLITREEFGEEETIFNMVSGMLLTHSGADGSMRLGLPGSREGRHLLYKAIRSDIPAGILLAAGLRVLAMNGLRSGSFAAQS
jgi:alpha-galactosidase